jgi:hypothetical protein
MGASELGDAVHPSILKKYGDTICDMIVWRLTRFFTKEKEDAKI